LREWLALSVRNHTDSYRHCLFVTGSPLRSRSISHAEDDQPSGRAALLHDVARRSSRGYPGQPGNLSDED